MKVHCARCGYRKIAVFDAWPKVLRLQTSSCASSNRFSPSWRSSGIWERAAAGAPLGLQTSSLTRLESQTQCSRSSKRFSHAQALLSDPFWLSLHWHPSKSYQLLNPTFSLTNKDRKKHLRPRKSSNSNFSKALSPPRYYATSYEAFQNYRLSTYEECCEGFDASLIRDVLLSDTKSTLQNLTILGPPMRLSYMGSLREFEVLTELHTHWELSLPNAKAQFSAAIPESLLRLWLNDVELRDASTYGMILRDTLSNKLSGDLHLRYLTIITPGCDVFF